MKRSHQRLMKLVVPPCMVTVALSISGYTFSEINKMQEKAQKDSARAREKVLALSARKPQALTWLDNQRISPVPVAQVSREKKRTAPACYITQARKGEVILQELGQRITAICDIPMITTPNAANSTLEGGATRQMAGTLPAPDENGRLPLSSLGSTTMTTSTQPLTPNNLMWQGDIDDLLDLMASRSGLYWRMDNGRVVFYLTKTRMYPPHMLNTKASSSSSISSSSTSIMGATEGQDNSASGDATSSQSTTVGQKYDLYEDIRKTIEAVLTPEKGRHWLPASNSTLTVTDTPAVQETVARYVDEQNSIMNRRVALSVQVLSISNTRSEQFGLGWNLVYKSLHSTGATLNNTSGDSTGATSADVSILDTATGNAAKFSGSSLLIKALSEQGDISVVTSRESTITSLTPVPIQMADQTACVAQPATTTTMDVGTTATLTPGMIITEFNVTLLPLIQKTGNFQLQMNFDLSDPPTIRSFTSKGGSSYIEIPYTKLRSLSQRVNLRGEQSLVVTNFDQNDMTTSKAGTFTSADPLFGGSQAGKSEHSALVIIITPTFPSGGNNG